MVVFVKSRVNVLGKGSHKKNGGSLVKMSGSTTTGSLDAMTYPAGIASTQAGLRRDIQQTNPDRQFRHLTEPPSINLGGALQNGLGKLDFSKQKPKNIKFKL